MDLGIQNIDHGFGEEIKSICYFRRHDDWQRGYACASLIWRGFRRKILGVEQARIHDLKEVGAMLDLFQEHGGTVVDIARVYGLGSSEEYLGQLDWQG